MPIIIIEAVGVEQAHGAIDCLQPWIQTQEHQKKPAESERRKRRETRKHKTREKRRSKGCLITQASINMGSFILR